MKEATTGATWWLMATVVAGLAFFIYRALLKRQSPSKIPTSSSSNFDGEFLARKATTAAAAAAAAAAIAANFVACRLSNCRPDGSWNV